MEKYITKIENGFKVSKSNSLIRAAYKLTTNEQKLILIAISLISPDDKDFHTYEITIKTIAEILKVKRKDLHKSIENITFNILKKPFKYVNDKNERVQLNWFSICKYKEGIVKFRFDPEIKSLLLDLKENFTSYYLGYAVKLKSRHAIRMYELLRQVKSIVNVIFELEELRYLLGIEKEEYPDYYMFKKRIILASQKELKEKTDISFDFKEIKKVRRVIKLKFIVKPNTRKVEEAEDSDLFNFNNLTYNLLRYGVSENQIKEIKEKKNDKEIEFHFEQFIFMKKNFPSKVKGDSSFIYNSTIKGWRYDEYLDYLKNKDKNKTKKQVALQKKVKKEYEKYCEDNYTRYETLDEEKRKSIDNRVKEEMKSIKSKEMLSLQTLDDIAEGYRKSFLLEEFKEKVSFDIWIEGNKEN